MGIVLNWSSNYPTAIDDTVTNFPTMVDGVHDVMASHVNELAAAVIALETRVDSFTVREADGSPIVSNVKTIIVPNDYLTDNGSGEIELDFLRLNTVTGEPTGFPNRTDSSISVNSGTRTFSIQPTGASFDIYSSGVKYNKTSTESVVWTDVEGLHVFYYETNGVLTHAAGTSLLSLIFENKVPVALVWWDATNKEVIAFSEERHGLTMDGASHVHMHLSLGTQWISGGGLGNFTIDGDGSVDAHAQFSVGNSVIRDEDIEHSILNGSPQTLSAIAELPVLYKLNAGGDWRKKAANTFPIIEGGSVSGYAGTLPAWNEFTGGSWQLTEVASGNYFLAHVVATNDIDTPIFAVCGQAEYPNLNKARTGATEEANTLVLDDLFAEYVVLGTVIFQADSAFTNTVKTATRTTDEGDDYVDFRARTSRTATPSSSHSVLTNLDHDDHPQYSLVDGTRAFTGPVGGADAVASSDLTTLSQVNTIASAVTLDDVINATSPDNNVNLPSADPIVWNDNAVDGFDLFTINKTGTGTGSGLAINQEGSDEALYVRTVDGTTGIVIERFVDPSDRFTMGWANSLEFEIAVGLNAFLNLISDQSVKIQASKNIVLQANGASPSVSVNDTSNLVLDASFPTNSIVGSLNTLRKDQTLDYTITSDYVDNNVNLPSADPIVWNDNAVDGFDLFTINKTGTGTGSGLAVSHAGSDAAISSTAPSQTTALQAGDSSNWVELAGGTWGSPQARIRSNAGSQLTVIPGDATSGAGATVELVGGWTTDVLGNGGEVFVTSGASTLDVPRTGRTRVQTGAAFAGTNTSSGELVLFTGAPQGSGTAGGVYIAATGVGIPVATDYQIDLEAANDIVFDANGMVTPTPFNEAGDLDLSGFTATSVIGALNELKSSFTGSDTLDEVMTSGTTDNSVVVPSSDPLLLSDGGTGLFHVLEINRTTASSGSSIRVEHAGSSDAVVINTSGTGAALTAGDGSADIKLTSVGSEARITTAQAVDLNVRPALDGAGAGHTLFLSGGGTTTTAAGGDVDISSGSGTVTGVTSTGDVIVRSEDGVGGGNTSTGDLSLYVGSPTGTGTVGGVIVDATGAAPTTPVSEQIKLTASDYIFLEGTSASGFNLRVSGPEIRGMGGAGLFLETEDTNGAVPGPAVLRAGDDTNVTSGAGGQVRIYAGTGTTNAGGVLVSAQNSPSVAATDQEITLEADLDIVLDARGMASPLPLNEPGDLDLSGFTASSVVGALNELKSGVGAVTLDDVINAASPDNNVNVPSGSPVVLADGGVDGFDVFTVAKSGAGSGSAIQVSSSGTSAAIEAEAPDNVAAVYAGNATHKVVLKGLAGDARVSSSSDSNLTVIPGDAATGQGQTLSISGGWTQDGAGNGGDVIVTSGGSGLTTIPSTGDVFVRSRNAPASSNADTGDVYIYAGEPQGTGVPGGISIDARGLGTTSTPVSKYIELLGDRLEFTSAADTEAVSIKKNGTGSGPAVIVRNKGTSGTIYAEQADGVDALHIRRELDLSDVLRMRFTAADEASIDTEGNSNLTITTQNLTLDPAAALTVTGADLSETFTGDGTYTYDRETSDANSGAFEQAVDGDITATTTLYADSTPEIKGSIADALVNQWSALYRVRRSGAEVAAEILSNNDANAGTAGLTATTYHDDSSDNEVEVAAVGASVSDFSRLILLGQNASGASDATLEATDDVILKANGGGNVLLNETGDLTISGTDLTNTSIVGAINELAGNVNQKQLDSGSDTPTASSLLNISSVTGLEVRWAQIGNTVLCSFYASVTFSSAGDSTFDFTIPVATDNTFADLDQAPGSFNLNNSGFDKSQVFSATGTRDVRVRTNAPSGQTAKVRGTFGYKLNN